MSPTSQDQKSQSDASFGSKKNYLIATLAGLASGPFFLVSPFVLLLTDKAKGTKEWSNSQKWWAWAIAGAIITPITWSIMSSISYGEQKRTEIAEQVDALVAKKVNDSNYIQINTQLIALLHDACYSSTEESECLKISNTSTWLDQPQRNQLNNVLKNINQEVDNEKERQRLEAARKKAEAEELRRQSIADGTYQPTEFEVGRPCKELAEENALTGRVDWGWFGMANSRWYPSSKTLVLEGKTKNAFGVKIPFKISCQWQKGGIVKVVGLSR